MNNDLISRKSVDNLICKLIQNLESKGLSMSYDMDEIINLQIDVENIQIAYDVDKVINKISNKMFSAELYGDEWDGQTVNNLLCMGDVYEIVKGGGIDD